MANAANSPNRSHQATIYGKDRPRGTISRPLASDMRYVLMQAITNTRAIDSGRAHLKRCNTRYPNPGNSTGTQLGNSTGTQLEEIRRGRGNSTGTQLVIDGPLAASPSISRAASPSISPSISPCRRQGLTSSPERAAVTQNCCGVPARGCAGGLVTAPVKVKQKAVLTPNHSSSRLSSPGSSRAIWLGGNSTGTQLGKFDGKFDGEEIRRGNSTGTQLGKFDGDAASDRWSTSCVPVHFPSPSISSVHFLWPCNNGRLESPRWFGGLARPTR